MFRNLVRRAATRAPRQRSRLARSVVSRSRGASTLVASSIIDTSLAGPRAAQGSVGSFHTSAPTWEPSKVIDGQKPPFEKLMAANRGEIATRIVRAASELGIKTAGIYAHEGKLKGWARKPATKVATISNIACFLPFQN